MADPAANRAIIESFWDDLYRMDYEALSAKFAPDGEYTDVASPEDDVARGPAEVAARLRLAFEPLEEIGDERRHLIADGDLVFTEHVEHWRWPSGETMALPVASVHELRDGKIVRWWDYWDMAVLTQAAPDWWFEHVMQGYK
ncbi:MAG TPA: nuclear transport factor 2 family protein [Acidimicrobiales bacterium]|nr:nuclear transport factor 2 family protein [Acidimicrobiales bacterium]